MKITKTGKKIKTVFFTAIFSLSAFKLFATPTQYEMIKETEKQEAATEAKEIIVRPNIEYKAEGLNDPFADPFLSQESKEKGPQNPAAEAPAPNITVQGLIWGGNFPQAIINNKVVKVGDTIEGARIISIDKDDISVFFNERQYHLSTSSEKDQLKGKP